MNKKNNTNLNLPHFSAQRLLVYLYYCWLHRNLHLNMLIHPCTLAQTPSICYLSLQHNGIGLKPSYYNHSIVIVHLSLFTMAQPPFIDSPSSLCNDVIYMPNTTTLDHITIDYTLSAQSSWDIHFLYFARFPCTIM